MQVDWLIVAAQLVNFLILLWLLQRFLYRPILRAINRREDEIRRRLSQAATSAEQAEGERQRLQLASAQIAFERNEKLDAAKIEADTLREELLVQAHTEVDAARADWIKALEAEKRDFASQATDLAARRLMDIAGRVLTDLSGADLEAAMVAAFQTRLKDTADQTMQNALVAGPIKVISADKLTGKTQTKIGKLLGGIANASLAPEFVVDPSQIAGLAVTAGSHHYDGSLRAYLETFEHDLLTSLGLPLAPEVKTGARP